MFALYFFHSSLPSLGLLLDAHRSAFNTHNACSADEKSVIEVLWTFARLKQLSIIRFSMVHPCFECEISTAEQ